mgnify:CR=1 FL=1
MIVLGVGLEEVEPEEEPEQFAFLTCQDEPRRVPLGVADGFGVFLQRAWNLLWHISHGNISSSPDV